MVAFQSYPSKKTMKIAVCLYGQPRTAKYCAKWTLESYNFGNYDHETTLWAKRDHWESRTNEKYSDKIQVDYFCDLKNSSFCANDIGSQNINHGNLVINEIKNLYNPKNSALTPAQLDEKISKDKPATSTMFSSMCRTVEMKEQYEIENSFVYDFVFLQRYDLLVGPHVTSLREMFHKSGVQPFCLYGGVTNLRFINESFRGGFYDFIVWGDSFSIDALCSRLYQNWAVNDYTQLVSEYSLGPNTYLSNAACDAGLLYQPLPLSFALVRETANLSIPIFDSFSYHETFWVGNAVWNQK